MRLLVGQLERLHVVDMLLLSLQSPRLDFGESDGETSWSVRGTRMRVPLTGQNPLLPDCDGAGFGIQGLIAGGERAPLPFGHGNQSRIRGVIAVHGN